MKNFADLDLSFYDRATFRIITDQFLFCREISFKNWFQSLHMYLLLSRTQNSYYQIDLTDDESNAFLVDTSHRRFLNSHTLLSTKSSKLVTLSLQRFWISTYSFSISLSLLLLETGPGRRHVNGRESNLCHTLSSSRLDETEKRIHYMPT